MKNSLLPADTYTIINQTILTEVDKKIIISLYEPIVGPIAVSLYLTLWADLDKLELMSKDFTHHHLMTILKTKLVDIENARKSLEAVGLLKSYIKFGYNVVNKLNGIFSFAIWDSNKKELFMARDHFGVKPFYYSIIDETLVFASEVKALFKYPGIKAKIDSEGIAELFGLRT